MKQVFEDENTEAVILVDASNAFNSLNRQVALHNIQYTCPPFAKVLINTYRQPSRLFVAGGKEISSREGTTQGDNLAGPFYALGTTPLQNKLRETSPEIKQVWLADDATGGGSITNLKSWWDTIINEGVKFGYYVNENKSWLILKDPSKIQLARDTFQGTAINFTTEGMRHLGAALGSEDFKTRYVSDKVAKWCEEIHQLAEIAKSQPQAAYAAFTHGERHRFSYFMRTIPGMKDLIQPLDDVIDKELIPAILGNDTFSPIDRELFSLPLRFGGLGLPVFSSIAEEEYLISKQLTAPLTTIMFMQGTTIPDTNEVAEIKRAIASDKEASLKH